MSSGCGDVLSLADLQTAKKHQLFEAEVITGRSGGVAGGVPIDYATNQATGQTQKTMPAILRDLGFEPGSGDFTTGFVVMPGQRDTAWFDPVSVEWYSYLGVIPPAGFVVSPGTNPVGDPNWKITREHLFTQSGAGAVTRQSQDKMRETVSVPDYGLGIPAFNSAKAHLGLNPALLPIGYFDIGANAPDYEIKGPGKVIANGISSGGSELSYNPARESVFYTPATYQRELNGINYPPPRGVGYETSSYNSVFALGSKLQDHTKNIRFTVAFGNLIGSAPLSWGYIDAFGVNTLAYAGNVERTTAVGSESLGWFGAPNQEWLRTYQHDWWRKPASNPFEPGEPGWDADGLETKFPGIGDRIAAFTDYAIDSTEAGFTTTLGRDAGNRIVAGIRNVFSGYQCAWQMFSGSFNVGYGALALNNVVFGDALTAIGDQAGRDCLDSTNAVFMGYAAGRTVQKATSSVIIGDRTADNVLVAERAVIIGAQAGAYHPVSLSDKLVISNDNSTAKLPLISGDFVGVRGGVSLRPESIRAKWHVRAAGSGSVLTPEFGLLVEGFNVAAITIETNNTGFGNLNFADPDGVVAGGLTYGHSSNSLTLKTNAVERWKIAAAGIFHPATDNNLSIGIAALRPSVIYAGTGAINTSDERVKTFIDIDAAETAVAKELKGMIRKFKFNDAIEAKGIDGARIHFGVGAQSVGEAFTRHGLDPHNYALFCYDEWGDEFEEHAAEYEEIPAVTEEVGGATIEVSPASQRLVKEAHTVQTQVAGNRYGIRYDELLTFIISAM